MLFCLFVKNFAENDVLVNDVICIPFIDYFGFNLNIFIRTLKNSSVNKTNVTILSHNIRIKNRNNRSCTNASGICQLPPVLRNKILYIFLEFILT